MIYFKCTKVAFLTNPVKLAYVVTSIKQPFDFKGHHFNSRYYSDFIIKKQYIRGHMSSMVNVCFIPTGYFLIQI